MADTVIYRIPGFPCGLSLQYAQSLRERGWNSDIVDTFLTEIPRYESACLTQSSEEALSVFVSFGDLETHKDFLLRLHTHIRMLAKAQIAEELHRKATTKDRDSLAAAELLNQISEGDVSPTSADIHFIVRDAVKEVQVTRGNK